MFEKYRLALANPRRSPRASLEKGGTGLLVKEQGNDLVFEWISPEDQGKRRAEAIEHHKKVAVHGNPK